MLWRVTLAVAAVCVGGMCSRVQADLMSKLILPRDYGVKLCGREFIRAVIFTCGGSRWRRSMDGDLDAFQWRSLSDVAVEDNNHHSWQPGAELPDPSPLRLASSYSLADLLAVIRQEQSLGDPALQEASQPSSVLGERDDWPVPRKEKRNFSLGVAGKCCNQGCTKNDIGQLC
ncbi:prorelaxin H1 [Acanthopagrus schlegelii]